MASLDGFLIFGRSVVTWLDDEERARQENAYAGVNGVEGQDLGSRGSYCHVTGLLVGALITDYTFAEDTIRSYKDGLVHTLIDNYGRIFYRAKLHQFNPEGGKMTFDPWYGFVKPYTATFRIYDVPPYQYYTP